MKKKKDIKQMVIFQAKSGAIELRGDISRETIWATQAQIAEVFQAERSVITKHIRNMLEDKEIGEKSNMQKMHIANSDKPTTSSLTTFQHSAECWNVVNPPPGWRVCGQYALWLV